MLIYISLFVLVISISTLVLALDRKNIGVILAIYSAILILFSGLRYHTGWDWEAYDYFFDKISNGSITDLKNNNIFNYEPGFLILSYLSLKLNISPYITASTITVALILISARKYCHKYIYVFLIAYLFYGYFHNFSIIRQGISAAIFAYALQYILSKKYIRYYASIIIASSFHSSALILLLIPAGVYVLQKTPIIILLVVSLLMVYFNLSEISEIKNNLSHIESINFYLKNEDLSYKVGFSFKYLEILILLFFFCQKKCTFILRQKYGDENYLLFKSLLIIELLNYSIFNDFSIIYERINVYFEFTHAVIIVMVASIFKFKKIQFIIILLLSAIIFIRYFQLIHSPVRIDGELSHYDRFNNYCSVINKYTCQR